MNYKCLLSSFVIVACCLQQCCWAQSTTVRPYKFGFNIDQQQHRREMRDERGIVMGEFGFITADGIYHVTVYATDEQGRFRILAMKNYPYESPPKTVEVMVQPKTPPTTTTTTTTTTTPKPLAKHNFNTQACSGCFLTNGNNKPKGLNAIEEESPKTGIKSSPHSSVTATSDSKSAKDASSDKTIHTTPSAQPQTKFFTTPNTQHTNRMTALNEKEKTPSPSEGPTTSYQSPIAITQALGSSKSGTTNNYLTTSVTNFKQHLKQIPQTHMVDEYATGPVFDNPYQGQTISDTPELKSRIKEDHTHPAGDVHKSSFKTSMKKHGSVYPRFYEIPPEQRKNAKNIISTRNKEETSIPCDQSLIVCINESKPNNSDLNSAATVHTQTSLSDAVQRNLKSPALSQKHSFLSKLPVSTNTHTSSTNSTTLNRNSHTHFAHTNPTIKKVLHKQNTALPVLENSGSNQKFSPAATQGGLPAVTAPQTTTVNPPPIMDIIMQKVLPALMGKTGQSATTASATQPATFNNNNNKPNAVPSGQKPGVSNNAVPKKPTGSSGPSALNGDGDLYRFKYILDYHGHTETGKRNGNKEGSYFAIGDDNVERTIEYVANEFGYQPRVRWRKLDSNAIKSNENTLKDYEFVWFSQ